MKRYRQNRPMEDDRPHVIHRKSGANGSGKSKNMADGDIVVVDDDDDENDGRCCELLLLFGNCGDGVTAAEEALEAHCWCSFARYETNLRRRE